MSPDRPPPLPSGTTAPGSPDGRPCADPGLPGRVEARGVQWLGVSRPAGVGSDPGPGDRAPPGEGRPAQGDQDVGEPIIGYLHGPAILEDTR